MLCDIKCNAVTTKDTTTKPCTQKVFYKRNATYLSVPSGIFEYPSNSYVFILYRHIFVMEHARTPLQKFFLRMMQAATTFQKLFFLASI
jgi:hypothetical protein